MSVADLRSSNRLYDIAERYRADGYVVVRGLFDRHEMQELADEADRLLSEHYDLIDPLNLRCRYMPHCETGEKLFEVFDPVNDLSPVCERFSQDARILTLLEAIYGEPAVLFKDKLIFKPPGATGYRLHQDIPLAWPGFPNTFLTVLFPIDPCSEDNGCTEVYRGYHTAHLSDDAESYMLSDSVVDRSRRLPLEMEPGDVAIFHGLTPHRSEPNRSTRWRRTLYTSYNAISDGGDQREAHYAEFQLRMRERFAAAGVDNSYFK